MILPLCRGEDEWMLLSSFFACCFVALRLLFCLLLWLNYDLLLSSLLLLIFCWWRQWKQKLKWWCFAAMDLLISRANATHNVEGTAINENVAAEVQTWNPAVIKVINRIDGTSCYPCSCIETGMIIFSGTSKAALVIVKRKGLGHHLIPL